MTTVECKRCGRDLHYTGLAWVGDNEYVGLCFECVASVLYKFIVEQGLFEKLAGYIEQKYSIKNGDIAF